MPCRPHLAISVALCMACSGRAQWQEVPAAGAPLRRDEHTAVLDAQQRTWIFGGRDVNWERLNDLHYFDVEAKAWQKVSTSNTPPKRGEHTAVLDAQGWMWIFGGSYYHGDTCMRLNDLHYFDIEAQTWQEVIATSAPSKRNGHTAVMDAQQMWVFGGCDFSPRAGPCSSWLNDLHHFDVKAMAWQEFPTNANTPSKRSQHTAVLDARQCMWIFGGQGPSGLLNDLHCFDLSAQTWREVPQALAGNAPSQRWRHTAVMDAQRMWVFGGRDVNPGPSKSLVNDLHYFDVELQRWQEVTVNNSSPAPSKRWRHTAVMDIHQQMWIFGGEEVVGDGWIKLNDLYTFDVKGAPPPETPPASLVELDERAPEGQLELEASQATSSFDESAVDDIPMWLWVVVVPAGTLCLLVCLRVLWIYRARRARKLAKPPFLGPLPPEAAELGVAATYLVNVFPPLATRAAAKKNPNFYEICPHFAHGEQGLGYNKICPRDGKPHCSVVDALEDGLSGKVSHFVSWCWAYSLEDVVSAVEGWLGKSGANPDDVFLWMCFFCNNQYRIMEGCQTGSQHLQSVFESHLAAAGQMLLLLDKIQQPVYTSRAWCIFESYVCIQHDIPMTIILPDSAEASFRDSFRSGDGIQALTSALDAMDVRHAKASSEADELLIKGIIRNSLGFHAVNTAVRSRLVDQLTFLFRELLMQQNATDASPSS